jgi:hypothetical protein
MYNPKKLAHPQPTEPQAPAAVSLGAEMDDDY